MRAVLPSPRSCHSALSPNFVWRDHDDTSSPPTWLGVGVDYCGSTTSLAPSEPSGPRHSSVRDAMITSP